jgi:hypothetical protein
MRITSARESCIKSATVKEIGPLLLSIPFLSTDGIKCHTPMSRALVFNLPAFRSYTECPRNKFNVSKCNILATRTNNLIIIKKKIKSLSMKMH